MVNGERNGKYQEIAVPYTKRILVPVQNGI